MKIDRQKDRQIGRQIDRKIDRQKERKIERWVMNRYWFRQWLVRLFMSYTKMGRLKNMDHNLSSKSQNFFFANTNKNAWRK